MTRIWRMFADFFQFLESVLIRPIRVIRGLFHCFVSEA